MQCCMIVIGVQRLILFYSTHSNLPQICLLASLKLGVGKDLYRIGNLRFTSFKTRNMTNWIFRSRSFHFLLPLLPLEPDALILVVATITDLSNNHRRINNNRLQEYKVLRSSSRIELRLWLSEDFFTIWWSNFTSTGWEYYSWICRLGLGVQYFSLHKT